MEFAGNLNLVGDLEASSSSKFGIDQQDTHQFTGSVEITGSATIVGKLDLNAPGSSVFIGTEAGLSNNGVNNLNVGVGYHALRNNTDGAGNSAVGYYALRVNTSGACNTSNGYLALSGNTIGSRNSAYGYGAMTSNTSASDNTSIGYDSLTFMTGGSCNVALGSNAGKYYGTASSTLTSSTNSIFIGQDARPQSNSQLNQIVIGYQARGNGTNTVTIGNSNITDNYFIGNILTTGDITGFYSSDDRLKENKVKISEPLDKIEKISGYSFDWKETPSYSTSKKDVGVIAQEIEEILPEIVTIRDNGYKAVWYEKIIPLLIEGIKELKNNQDEHKKEIEYLKSKIK
jgi:hypothetical protein